MAMKRNPAAVSKAKDLIRARHYLLDSSWGDENPGADEENAFLERHGWDRYGEWHLAVDDEASEETKERYRFPYGDFRRVHRSGLLAAKQRAAQYGYDGVERAADELLSLLEKSTTND